jgi:hypothetical protein
MSAAISGGSGTTMPTRAALSLILDNNRLTSGLDDAEARMLVEWLVERAEQAHAREPDEERVQAEVRRLCLRARAIARFVGLWCHERLAGAALQLAATERFAWPLPTSVVDACELMHDILAWESRRI